MSVRQGLAVAVAATLSLSSFGCSGGGGGGTTGGGDPTTSTGVFHDSPVAGIGYRTATQSGFTNARGEYGYVPGEKVTFFIGDLALSEVDAGPVVTPMTIFGADVDDARVVNLARLLQTLDTNGYPEDGITIAAAAHDAAEGLTTVSWSDTTGVFDTEVDSVVQDGGGSTTLVSATDAQAHLERETSIVGTWLIADPDDASIAVVTFFADGTYVLGGDKLDTPYDVQPGIERGTYAWNPDTGVFTTTQEVDTDGSGGFSDPVFASEECTSPTDIVATVAGDALTFVDCGFRTTVTRVRPVAGSILGPWMMGATDASQLVVITFFSDGTYLLAGDGQADTAGQPGMERGGYTWSSTTGAFTSTCPDPNTDGEWGFSHPAADGVCTGVIDGGDATVAGETLTISDANGSGTFTRTP